MSIRLSPTFRDVLAPSTGSGSGRPLAGSRRPLAGVWVSSGSPLIAEICAGSGVDWLLIDGEHSPIGLESIVAILQASAPYPVTPLVRVPWGDPVLLKQVLDLGAQNVLIPMVSSADEARTAVEAVRYPPRGRRGVGSALARSARWNRVDDYLANADEHVSLTVQIETAEGVAAAAEIAAVDGVDAVFVGPSDLAASMGLLGQQSHPEVTAAVLRTFGEVHGAGKPVGVNAFDEAVAQAYADAGADFLAVGADVALLARSTEALAARWTSGDDTGRASY